MMFFRKKPKRNIRILPADITVSTRGNRSILQAAKRSRVQFPHWCESGRCCQCQCRLISGEITSPNNKWERLSKENLPDDTILACQSIAATDLVIEIPAQSMAEMNRIKRS